MNTQRMVAILFIASFVAALLAVVLVNVSGIYATQDINVRLQIIAADKTHWLVDQAPTFLYILLTTIGFAVLASILRKTENAWFPTLAAIFLLVGGLSGEYGVYLNTIDPSGWYSGTYRLTEHLAYWFWLAGLLLFGVACLWTSLPAWLGYLTASLAIVYGLVFLLTGTGFLTPFIMEFLSLVMGVVLLRRQIVAT